MRTHLFCRQLCCQALDLLSWAPAAMATWRACRLICPRWMPSVARARSAARFCARPTETMISASSAARLHTHQLQGRLGRDGRVLRRRLAHRHRHLQTADQIPVASFPQVLKAGIAAIAGSIGMRACFDRAPVVAGGDDHRIHTVHNAFVVGGCPVGISGGKSPGSDDAVAHIFSAEVIESQRSAGVWCSARAPGAGLPGWKECAACTRPPVIASTWGQRSTAVLTALAPMASRTS